MSCPKWHNSHTPTLSMALGWRTFPGSYAAVWTRYRLAPAMGCPCGRFTALVPRHEIAARLADGWTLLNPGVA